MYRKSWRYYRDSFLFWMPFLLLLLSAGYALTHPVYWPFVLFFWFLRNPVRRAFSFAHPFRRFGWMQETHLEFREVTFKSRDGLTLFGRFFPGRNKATILLLHGLGQSTPNMLLHAEFLTSAGYGIFMIDLRAHGSSDGDTSTYGLREADDVAGAVDYLLTRIDVNGQKIGALGISLGAQAALRGALKTRHLKALVLEGLNPSVLSDHGGRTHSLVHWLNYPTNWLYYKLYHFMSGGKDSGVLEVIGKIAPRPILLIASSEKDIYFNRLFYQAANEPKELWELPGGEHGAAILKDSHTYIQRVVEFFNKSLLQMNKTSWRRKQMSETNKLKLSGGPEKTVTWIWLDPETGGQLKVEFYDFSEPAQRTFGNDIAYTITVNEMDKVFALTKQNETSFIPWMAEKFQSYFDIKHWLEANEFEFSVEIESWA